MNSGPMRQIAGMKVKTSYSEHDIMSIPLARAGEYELSDVETRRLRSFVYSLNRNNAAGRRWRTLRDGKLLLVWRIR